ncbi:galactose-3-O-sulfotransferase 2-like [Amphiura filiformis]|uniref:galactose-3-O-sulfotransferase 2-like n=1 Tax=Amphiura filiformis TaxID=82378 RepID=UPI003B211DFB
MAILRKTVIGMIGVLIVVCILLATLQTTNIGNRSSNRRNVKPEPSTSSSATSTSFSQCTHPVHKLIFIKTHKTGSSTIATTLARYADEKGLKLATPIWTHIFHEIKSFSHNMVLSFRDMGHFGILTSHARYNRKEMDMVISNPKYITIIRNPVKQLESAYSYYSMAKHIGIQTDGDHELQAFLKQPRYYFDNYNYFMKVQSWNGQIFDLGLEHADHLNQTLVRRKIQQIDAEFDLVMINEYFDESLVLLRKQFCWDWEDIVYISKGVRKTTLRHKITPELAAKIQHWNSADVQLYDHFNRTFWEKIAQYGPNFNKDVLYFKELRGEITSRCLDMNSHSNPAYDKRVENHKLKPNAPNYCKNMISGTMQYVNWLKFMYVFHRLLLPLTLVCLVCVFMLLLCRRFRRGNGDQYRLLELDTTYLGSDKKVVPI